MNEQDYNRKMKYYYVQTAVSIEKKFQSMQTEGILDFDVFKAFAAEYATDYQHKRHVLQARTTDEVFVELSAANYISQHDTNILQDLLIEFGGSTQREEQKKLAYFEQQRGFVEFSVTVSHYIAEETVCTMADLKLCVLSTPIPFGSYYSMLENETDVYVAMRILSDWKDPRLLQRAIRHFCPQYEDWIERYSQRLPSPEQAPPGTPARELLEHQEKFTDLLMTIVRDLNSSHSFPTDPLSVPLSETHPELQLAPIKENTVSGILLALLPFCSYKNIHLLRELESLLSELHNYCSNTTSIAQELHAFTTQWNKFAAKTTIKAVYDTQLNEFPLQLSARGVSTITLHLQGEDWKDPTLSQISELALFMADTLKLKRWSVVPYRTILTGSETDAKGHCKVELLTPTMAACILMKEGASETEPLTKLCKNNITYVEVGEKFKYYFSCTPESIAHMYKQASQHMNLTSYFEQLENITTPPALAQGPDLSTDLTYPFHPLLLTTLWCIHVLVLLLYLCSLCALWS